jgi:spore maturation protein CgeB
MARYGFSPPTRVFEAAGAGACIITDEWVGIELFLEPGAEVLVASDGEAVARFVDAVTPVEAQRIGEAARARILAQHTYDHRAVEVMALLGNANKRREAAWA